MKKENQFSDKIAGSQKKLNYVASSESRFQIERNMINMKNIIFFSMSIIFAVTSITLFLFVLYKEPANQYLWFKWYFIGSGIYVLLMGFLMKIAAPEKHLESFRNFLKESAKDIRTNYIFELL